MTEQVYCFSAIIIYIFELF
ncbi:MULTISPECIES: sporulation protein Cse60 [unclassified Clostridioides]|nr:sporulation protein Cse60 [Clostridioides sp. ZZV14-6045]MCC0740786.1 sporulation protein Cse60 [Clostridioides sp. ZZV14-5902]